MAEEAASRYEGHHSTGDHDNTAQTIDGSSDRRWLEDIVMDDAPSCDFFQSKPILALLIVSIVFLIFTCCMFFEQLEAIHTNVNKIARMKMSVGQAGTELARVTEEFNEMFGGDSKEIALHWFLPTAVEFPGGMKKVVLGYEWDETFSHEPYQEPNQEDEEMGGSQNGSITNHNNGIELTPTNTSRAVTPPPTPKSRLKDPPPGSMPRRPDAGASLSEPAKLTKRASSKDSIFGKMV